MRLQHAERLSHYMPQLLLVTGVHDGDRLWISTGRNLSMIVDAAQYNYIAADSRALALNNGPANCCDVAIHRSFHNHVATKRNGSFLDGTGDPNGLSEAENRRV